MFDLALNLLIVISVIGSLTLALVTKFGFANPAALSDVADLEIAQLEPATNAKN